MTNKITIKADSLHPYQGVASMKNIYTKAEWPAFVAGDHVEVHDSQGWIWDAEVLEVLIPGEDAKVKVLGEKRPQPFPTPDPDGFLMLPNLSGHAHVRNWRAQDVVQIGDSYFKVKLVPKHTYDGSRVLYKLVPATAAQYATRPGRVRMSDEASAHRAVGTAIRTQGGEWLHAKKVIRSRYGSAEGEYFGSNHFVEGNFVDAKKAEKLNDTHPILVSEALRQVKGERVRIPMPEDATVLIPRNPRTTVDSGERVAVTKDTVLFEKCGDPDQMDSWYAYVVEIKDPDLVARVGRFIKKNRKKT